MNRKLVPGVLLLLAVFGTGISYHHYREITEDRRQQTANLLTRCVNESLLSLFRLQANDWRRRPELHLREREKLSHTVTTLPGRLLDGSSFPEWRTAVGICGEFTEHSNARHRTIFHPLGNFAEMPVGDNRLLGNQRSRQQLLRRLQSVKVAARAADRYLQDLKLDIARLIADAELAPATKFLVEQQLNSEVLDRYRSGHYALGRVLAHLERVERFYQLLSASPRGWSLRAGSLYFHDLALRREVEQLNSALFQGESEFFANWKQVIETQQ